MKMFLVFLLLIVLLYLITSNKNNESFSQDYYPHLYNSNIIPCKK